MNCCNMPYPVFSCSRFAVRTICRVSTLAFLAIAFFASNAFAEEPLKPNIVLINVDDLGWADLACQGSKYYKTPNVDRLASQGMRFTNAYAAASNCAPSRACMLTGQYGPRHGVYTVSNSNRGKAEHRKLIPVRNTTSISEDNLTIAGLLETADYQTISIGKWHVSNDPLRNGFDQNVAGSRIGHPGAKEGGYHSPFNYPNCVSDKEGEYLTDRLTDEAISFATKNKDKPFFLYLPFYTVHTPIQPKADKKKKWKAVEKQPGQHSASYAAMVESMDENVGRLMASLDELGIAERTVVIFTSDNGGVWSLSHQDPLRAGKGSYFEGGIRVPLVVRWPGEVDAGTTNDEPVINVDFMPTIAEIAAVKIPAGKQMMGKASWGCCQAQLRNCRNVLCSGIFRFTFRRQEERKATSSHMTAGFERGRDLLSGPANGNCTSTLKMADWNCMTWNRMLAKRKMSPQSIRTSRIVYTLN